MANNSHNKACQLFATWAHNTYPRERMSWFLNNNETIGSRRGSLLKSQGLTAGVPDYTFLLGGVCSFVEVKVGKDRVSDKQKLFIDSNKDFKTHVVHGKDVEETVELLKALFVRLLEVNTYALHDPSESLFGNGSRAC